MGNYYFCRQLGIMLTIETTGLLQQFKKDNTEHYVRGYKSKASLCASNDR